MSPSILKPCLLFLLKFLSVFSRYPPFSCFLFLQSNLLHSRSSNKCSGDTDVAGPRLTLKNELEDVGFRAASVGGVIGG